MKSIADLIKFVMAKLMIKERYVDYLQWLSIIIFSAGTVRLALLLLGAEAFLKDAGAYLSMIGSGAMVVFLASLLLKKKPTIGLLWYFLIVFSVGALAVAYKIFTGTYVPVLH